MENNRHQLTSPRQQDQWQRKKQTKQQKKAARRAKLDPANQKSAKDVLDENERKRKREMEEELVSDVEDLSREKPREGLKPKKAKKQKLDKATEITEAEDDTDAPDTSDRAAQQAEKRRAKQQVKKEKEAKQKEKIQKKAQQKDLVKDLGADPAKTDTVLDPAVAKPAGQDDEWDLDVSDGMEVDVAQLADDISALPEADNVSSAVTSPEPEDPASPDSVLPSSTSSSSSIVPPATAPDLDHTQTKKRSGSATLSEGTEHDLHARLQAKIDALRASRKASGTEGKPSQSRQDLLAARRKKEDAKKQRKKELRKHAKEEEERQQAESGLVQLRGGSESPMTPRDVFSPQSEENSFSFGRVDFEDGQFAQGGMDVMRDAPRKKGPQDPKTALEAAEKKRLRLASLDEEKRKDIEEKDAWLNAKKRAHGERVRDDTSLLKKTLKRKQKQKEKSEKEWRGRIDGVQKGKEAKQRKREENLLKRKAEKGEKGKKGKGGKGRKVPTAGKKRAGFEGSFKRKK